MTQVEVKLSDTASQSNNTAKELDSLQVEAENLDNTVKELSEQLEFIKNSDIRGEHFLWKYSILHSTFYHLSVLL
jgi:coxsackievirus/adenovirus receptor